MSAEVPGRLRSVLADERIRFLLVGGFNTALGYGLFALVQWSIGRWISYFASLLIAHLCASLLAFVLYRRLVFRVSGNVVIDFLRFQTVYLIPLGCNLILLPVLVAGLGWNVYLAQATIVVATTLVTFVGHKYFSFRRARDVTTPDVTTPDVTPPDVTTPDPTSQDSTR